MAAADVLQGDGVELGAGDRAVGVREWLPSQSWSMRCRAEVLVAASNFLPSADDATEIQGCMVSIACAVQVAPLSVEV